jgi:hypothetical protein
MKNSSVIAAVALTGIVAGAAGYQLGKRQSANPGDASSVNARHGQRPVGGAERPSVEKTNLDGLRASLDAETDPLKRFNLALRNMEAWVATDPAGALAWLKSQQPSARRDEVIRRALLQYAETHPQGAAEWARDNLTGTDFHNALIRICEQWARNNGREAAAWAAALPQSQARDAALEGLTFAWAAQDPAAARQYLKDNPLDPTLSSILRYAAFAGWAKTDPRGAVAASLQSSREFNDPEQFANTLANWATVDVASAAKWLADNAVNPAERLAAAKELAGIFASHSPDAGVDWLQTLGAAEKPAALREFADAWASSDPAAAALWAAKLPAGEMDEETMSRILNGFLANDHAKFESWRNSLPDGPLKQQAMKAASTGEEE